MGNARRIRHLNFFSTKRKLATESLRQIVTARPSTEAFFPNVQTIWSIFEDPAFDPTFLGSSVQTLSLAILELQGIPGKIPKVAKKFPYLHRLSIASHRHVELLEGHLCELLTGLPSLTDVKVPINCLTSSVVEVASRMPKLRLLDGDHRRTQWHEMDSDSLPILETGAFPTLNRIAMTRTLAELLDSFNFPISQHILWTTCVFTSFFGRGPTARTIESSVTSQSIQ